MGEPGPGQQGHDGDEGDEGNENHEVDEGDESHEVDEGPSGEGYLRVAGIDPIQISPGVAFTLSATDFFGALLFLRRILGRCSLSVATRTRR